MRFYNDEWWKYAIMPFISGCIGWGTNVISLYMTFYPVEYRGIHIYHWKEQPFGLIGWQGIVPSKAKKMASMTTNLMTTKLLNARDIFNRIDVLELRKSLDPNLTLFIDKVVYQIAHEYFPTLVNIITKDEWDDMIAKILIDFDDIFFPTFLSVIQENLEYILDIDDLVVTACVEKKELLNRIFEECGAKELEFLRRSGFYFGFLFGLCQMFVWMFYRADWVLIVFGFIVGVITNFIALKFIFWPIEPIDIFNFRIHGLYLRRKDEVAALFSKIICTEILTVRSLWESILFGKLNRNFAALLRSHLLHFIDHIIGSESRMCISITVGINQVNCAKENTFEKVLDAFPTLIERGFTYMSSKFQIESTMRERLQSLTYAEFERLLHPAFEEDEWLLILVGGLLGAVVGLTQLFVLFT